MTATVTATVTPLRHPAGTFPIRQRPPLTCMLAGPDCVGTVHLYPGGIYCQGFHAPGPTRQRMGGAT